MPKYVVAFSHEDGASTVGYVEDAESGWRAAETILQQMTVRQVKTIVDSRAILYEEMDPANEPTLLLQTGL